MAVSPANAFSCTAGDPDGDGDLDIVFAQGNAASSSLQKVVMYENVDGAFDTIPVWQCDSVYYNVDCAFNDLDNDGDLDLVVGGKYAGIRVYYNHNGTLETSPSWFTNSIVGGRQIAFGDVDGDG
ncbi:MAG: VCBS repeat-containing protein, partial [candidate division Zixibacteria bacterium]|nr:VCBS repeat-containing protein [candidate division Zixibacteria bacterium]